MKEKIEPQRRLLTIKPEGAVRLCRVFQSSIAKLRPMPRCQTRIGRSGVAPEPGEPEPMIGLTWSRQEETRGDGWVIDEARKTGKLTLYKARG